MSLLPSVLALSLLMGGPADQAGPTTNVEPKPKPEARADDAPDGRLIFGFGASRLPWFVTGGKWTRTEPFWARVWLGDFMYVQVICYRPPSEWETDD